MNAWLADADADAAENPWLVLATPRVRRERRRTLNRRHKTTGNGAWTPFVPITPAMIGRAVAHLRTVLYSDTSMKGTTHVL